MEFGTVVKQGQVVIQVLAVKTAKDSEMQNQYKMRILTRRNALIKSTIFSDVSLLLNMMKAKESFSLDASNKINKEKEWPLFTSHLVFYFTVIQNYHTLVWHLELLLADSYE